MPYPALARVEREAFSFWNLRNGGKGGQLDDWENGIGDIETLLDNINVHVVKAPDEGIPTSTEASKRPWVR